MQEALRAALLAGPLTVKEIAGQIGKSESRVRELLKEDQTTIHSKKEDGRGNVFWLPEDRAEGTPATTTDTDQVLADTETHVDVTVGQTEVVDGEGQPADVTEQLEPTAQEVGVKQALADGMCPFCHATDGQTPAGPEGTFLGAANTCATCGKTYNRFSGDELQTPAPKEKGKRKPLNPQYKIAAKVAAVEAEGGKLSFDRETRDWVLVSKRKNITRMTAKEFSIETPESLVAQIA